MRGPQRGQHAEVVLLRRRQVPAPLTTATATAYGDLRLTRVYDVGGGRLGEGEGDQVGPFDDPEKTHGRTKRRGKGRRSPDDTVLGHGETSASGPRVSVTRPERGRHVADTDGHEVHL